MRPSTKKYNQLLDSIGSTLKKAKENAIKAINTELVKANWEIGKHIVEFEQQGKEKADYGSALLTNLSKDLKTKYGKGFSKSNIYLCRLFYIKYQKFQTVSGKLSWSHYAELLTVSDDLARSFYEKQATKENWSFREMKRQVDSALFQRLALSKNKKEVLALAEKGHELIVAKDAIKDPYVFEFLELPKDKVIKERGLEKKLVDNLQNFLLELGKGFRLWQGNLKLQLIMNITSLTLYFIIAYSSVLYLLILKQEKLNIKILDR